MKQFLIVSLFISMSLFSQENNDIFIVNKKVLLHLAKNKPVRNIYGVKTVSNTVKTSKKIKKKSIKYSSLKAQIDSIKLVKDSILALNLKKLQEYDEVNSIANNIQLFLESQKPYQLKKVLLQKAQTTALKYNFNQLIYADKDLNSSQKSKFLVMSLNPIELKIHLRRVKNLANKNHQKPNLDVFDDSLLVKLEQKFANTKPTYIVKTAGKSITTRRTFSSGKISDLSILSGTFKKVNDSYLILNDYKQVLKKNQILSSDELDELNIYYNQLKYKELDLIENIDTKKQYLVDNQFLKNYGAPK